jgi:aspartyl-tRNA(Asn)/glutamyl-tRNA(Gln) amidotransferase subunit A
MFFCATKQPNITIPIGLDSNGMPQSIMLAGAMYDDVGVLQVAHAIESAFPMPGCPLNN